jgi:hypothetical protein
MEPQESKAGVQADEFKQTTQAQTETPREIQRAAGSAK